MEKPAEMVVLDAFLHNFGADKGTRNFSAEDTIWMELPSTNVAPASGG